MAGNSALSAAVKAKKDEFYTQLTDIEKEMRYYRKHFKDKTVLCNCDDPFESNFFKYFVLNFNRLGLKKLIATCYFSSPIIGQQLQYHFNQDGQMTFSFGDDTSDDYKAKRPYKAIVTSVYDTTGDGGVDMVDVAKLFMSGENELSELDGDGDFRSQECLELLDESDIVVTNPPFSLFREYIATLMQHEKKFIIIGNVNAITYKEVFPLIMQNKIWIGASIHSGDRAFYVPDDYPLNAAGCGVDQDGRRFIRVKGVRWYTNLDFKQRHEDLMFEFDATDDYRFVLRLWYIGKQFIQFLCYRKNVEFSKVELAAPCENGTHETFAELYVLDEGVDTEIQTLKDGRYIKQAYISGHEGQILSDIASEKLYLRHLPDSFQSGKHIDAARFVMITAAFEWEFDRLFPDGICKSKERVEAELIVSQKLNELIDTSSGKTKKIYKSLLKCIERRPSLANKIEKIGSDMGALLEPFGQQLYGFNKEELNYTDMGKRLGDQRNYFAHGDLDKDFIGLSLLDLIFLQRIIYAIQLKISGLEDKQIQRAINDLFQCRFAI